MLCFSKVVTTEPAPDLAGEAGAVTLASAPETSNAAAADAAAAAAASGAATADAGAEFFCGEAAGALSSHQW